MAGEHTGPTGQANNIPVYVDVPALNRPGGHYSHAAKGGGLVFVSGQLPIASDGRRLADASFDEQATQVLANVRAALQAAGTDISQLLQVRVYLDDIANWPAFDKIYAQWAGPSRPARAVVPTGALHFGFKIEVEVTAIDAALGSPAV